MSLVSQITAMPRLRSSPFDGVDLAAPIHPATPAPAAGGLTEDQVAHLRFFRRHGMKAHEMEAIACLEAHMAEGGAIHLEQAIAFIEQLRYDQYP